MSDDPSKSESPHAGRAEDRSDAFVMHLTQSQLPLRSFIHTLARRSGDVDDVLQETNKVLWEKRHEYDPSRPFMPWACRFAYFQTMAHLKRASRADHLDLDENLCRMIAAEATHHVEQIEARAAALRECLHKLPAANRKLIDQRYAMGISVRKIADEIGQSADAVSMRLYRVRKALAQCIHKVMVQEP
ncbi:sigma-70 family RNA polymerase sigma factor [Planctomycetales bacterium ZRK34]|nr:sigma-70 family RNA polymerase sigma factor [Planctomycetales bacterium ZRK34]